MFSEHRLDIAGYRGRQVPNTFVRQDEPATHLAILLPGFGYSCDMPLFYYAEVLLLSSGADVLRVEYGYYRQPGFRESPMSDQIEWQLADATVALDVALQQRTYQQVTLIGKSIGTRTMGRLLTGDSRLRSAQAVWLTPVLNDENLRQQIRQVSARSLVVIGTADPHFDAGFLSQIGEMANHSVVTVADGDHSLDIDGEVSGSIRSLDIVMRRLGEFLSL